MAALHHLLGRPRHVVAEVVEAEFVVGAVGDVRGVGFATLRRCHVRENDAHSQTQESVDTPHPLRVALGKVVVDRHDVDTLAGQGIEVGGQGRHEGLALTRAHLGDIAQVKGAAAHDLHVVVTLTQRPTGRLAHGGEGFGQELIQALAVVDTGAVLRGQASELLVGHGDEVVLDGIDLPRDPLEGTQGLALTGPKDLVQNAHRLILDGGAVDPAGSGAPAAKAA